MTPALLLLVACTLAASDAVDGLARAFKPTRDPARALERRTAALERLGDRAGPDAVAALLAAARGLSVEITRIEEERRAYLSKDRRHKILEDRELLDPLRQLLDDVATRLRAMPDAPSAEAQLAAGLADERLPLTLRIELATRAADAGPTARAAVEAALDRPRASDALLPALVAARALGEAADALATPLLARLDDGSPAVREAAAAALAAARVEAALETLVAGLERERGRTRDRFGAALETLTGARLGTSAVAWRRWMAYGGRRATAPSSAGAVSRDEAAAYYGIPIDGASVVFVLDRSKSMNQSLAKKTAEGEKDAAAKTAPAGERRIDRARAELGRAVEMLRPDQTFNIVAFGSTCVLFADEPVAARPKTIARALAWIDEVELEWGTNLYDAMQRTFLMAGRGAADAAYDSRVDTIFVLTDGQPVIKTRYDDKRRIRAEVRRQNLLGRVVIHTIGLGEPLPKKFLRALAEENGGRFVHEKATPK